jgi:hypothetical protein
MLITQFQFQMQQQMQLQQLSQMLHSQNMLAKSPKMVKSPKLRKATRKAPENAQPLRQILAINLPENLRSTESVSDVFYPYGEASVQLLPPGQNLPEDAKPYAEKLRDLGQTYCAIIDLETARAAKFAVHVLQKRETKLGFKLGLLKPGIEEKLYDQKCQAEKSIDSGVTSASEQSDAEEENEWKQVGKIRYSREYLLSLQHKNKASPPKLVNLEHILLNPKPKTSKTELIRQPRGPLVGSKGFQRTRTLSGAKRW